MPSPTPTMPLRRKLLRKSKGDTEGDEAYIQELETKVKGLSGKLDSISQVFLPTLPEAQATQLAELLGPTKE